MSRAREEAALWLVRMDRGLSGAERVELAEWLEDSSHHLTLLDLGRSWRELDSLNVLAELFPLVPDAAVARRGLPSLPRWSVALAATACLAVVGGYALRQTGRAAIPGVAAVVSARTVDAYATAVGEHRRIELADGSTLTLNTDTLVEIEFAATARNVFLRRGEANFQVAHDTGRPFNVHAGTRVVQAVGTAFNVRLREGADIEVTVTEGKVRVLSGDATRKVASASAPARVEATIGAQQAARFDSGAAPVLPVAGADLDARLAWQRGMLLFRGEALQTVLDEVDRYTTSRFVIDDPVLRQERVGGYFRADDIEGLLLALRENFQIQAQRLDDGRIVLTRNTLP